MKTKLAVKIPPEAAILVKVGDNVTSSVVIAKVKDISSSLTIELSKILQIHPQKISKYMKKNIGDSVSKDEILALKKSLFSSTSVKSPNSGVIDAIDLTRGTITFREGEVFEEKIYSPIAGKITEVTPKTVLLECEGVEFIGEKGSGERVLGVLKHLKGEHIGVLTVGEDINKTIVIVHNITPAAIAKIDALGVRGIITTKSFENMPISYVEVAKNIYEKLVDYDGKEVVLDPSDKKIFILA